MFCFGNICYILTLEIELYLSNKWSKQPRHTLLGYFSI